MDAQPSRPIANITEAITRLATKTEGSDDPSPVDEAEWSSVLSARASEITEIHTFDQIDQAAEKQPFSWYQMDSMIAITFELPVSEINVNDKGITSPLLRGTWWGPISNFQMSEVGPFSQLVLTVDSQWPYLIRGGDPDPLSCFILARIAAEIDALELMRSWLRKGALGGNRIAAAAYAAYLTEINALERCVNFLCKAIVNFHDDLCGFLLAKILVGDSEYADPVLAENILCRLWSNGFLPAMGILARLYLNGAKGIKRQPAKAKLLLQLAVIQNDDEEAADLLKEGDFADRTDETEETADAAGGNEEGSSPLDWVIASGIAVAGVALTYFGFKVLRRWFK
jgi:hypothetical protein